MSNGASKGKKRKKRETTSVTLHGKQGVSFPHVCSSPCDAEASRPAGRAAAQPDFILLRDGEAAGGEMLKKRPFGSFPRGCSLACSGPVHVSRRGFYGMGRSCPGGPTVQCRFKV